jgi:hypothetical protein
MRVFSLPAVCGWHASEGEISAQAVKVYHLVFRPWEQQNPELLGLGFRAVTVLILIILLISRFPGVWSWDVGVAQGSAATENKA